MDIILISIELLIGSIIAYIIFYLLNKTKSVSLTHFNELTTKHNEAVSNIRAFEEKVSNFQSTNADLIVKLNNKEAEYSSILAKQSSSETQLKFYETKVGELTASLKSATDTTLNQQTEINQHKQRISELNANNNSISDSLNKQNTANDKQQNKLRN